LSEYLLLLCSALVSRWTNLFGSFGRARPARILVVKLDHVGDVILATPALRALRDAAPEVPIEVLIASGSGVVLEGNRSVDRILVYDSRRYRRGGDRKPGEPGGFEAMRQVARGGYTSIVELRGDWWTLLLPFLAGANRRVDRGSVRVGQWFARRFTRAGRARDQLHEVETNLEIVRPLLHGRRPERPAAEYVLSQPARDTLAEKLHGLGVATEAPLVCVHAGASWRPRAWRPERFADVADWIQEHYHALILFVGSADERDIEAAVRAKVKGRRAFWLAGALTWAELAALLARSRLFIGNDSGPAHLAAACGIPSVVLFGPQEPGRFRPWSERSIVLHHRVHCCPCRQTVCVHPENPCVNLIEVAEVQAQVRQLLGPPESFR
jgi:ADP-heptose:LPS heptosyltransferase